MLQARSFCLCLGSWLVLHLGKIGGLWGRNPTALLLLRLGLCWLRWVLEGVHHAVELVPPNRPSVVSAHRLTPVVLLCGFASEFLLKDCGRRGEHPVPHVRAPLVGTRDVLFLFEEDGRLPSGPNGAPFAPCLLGDFVESRLVAELRLDRRDGRDESFARLDAVPALAYEIVSHGIPPFVTARVLLYTLYPADPSDE